MSSLPISHKTLILDTYANISFLNLATEAGDYAVIVAASPGESVQDGRVAQPDGTLFVSYFTYALIQELKAANLHEVTYNQLITAIQDRMNTLTPRRQTPLFLGPRNRLVFAGREDAPLRLFDYS
jgi:hypothetical protein